MKEKITDLDRHRVMMKHAKCVKWELWRVRMSDWNDNQWQEFFNVRDGAKPKLMARNGFSGNPNGNPNASGRNPIIYMAVKGDVVLTGGAHTLSNKLGCHPDTIRKAEDREKNVKGFKITKL